LRRAGRIRFIQTVVRKHGFEDRKRDCLKKRFGAESLKDLDDEQLQQMYGAVSGWKKTAGKE